MPKTPEEIEAKKKSEMARLVAAKFRHREKIVRKTLMGPRIDLTLRFYSQYHFPIHELHGVSNQILIVFRSMQCMVIPSSVSPKDYPTHIGPLYKNVMFWTPLMNKRYPMLFEGSEPISFSAGEKMDLNKLIDHGTLETYGPSHGKSESSARQP